MIELDYYQAQAEVISEKVGDHTIMLTIVTPSLEVLFYHIDKLDSVLLADEAYLDKDYFDFKVRQDGWYERTLKIEVK